ncbi:MAG: hypothetical protein WA958_21080 [Tunicatimonas sp.]
MRTTIVDTIQQEAVKAKPKKEAIENDLKLAKERAVRQDLMKMRGKVDFWPGYQTVVVPPHAE